MTASGACGGEQGNKTAGPFQGLGKGIPPLRRKYKWRVLRPLAAVDARAHAHRCTHLWHGRATRLRHRRERVRARPLPHDGWPGARVAVLTRGNVVNAENVVLRFALVLVDICVVVPGTLRSRRVTPLAVFKREQLGLVVLKSRKGEGPQRNKRQVREAAGRMCHPRPRSPPPRPPSPRSRRASFAALPQACPPLPAGRH